MFVVYRLSKGCLRNGGSILGGYLIIYVQTVPWPAKYRVMKVASVSKFEDY
jgi:hypothetical protein